MTQASVERQLVAEEREVRITFKRHRALAMLKSLPSAFLEWKQAEDVRRLFHVITLEFLFDQALSMLGLKRLLGPTQIQCHRAASFPAGKA